MTPHYAGMPTSLTRRCGGAVGRSGRDGLASPTPSIGWLPHALQDPLHGRSMNDPDEATGLERRNRELTILNEIATALNESVDLPGSLEIALPRMADLFQLRIGWVWLLREADGESYLAAAREPSALARGSPRGDGRGLLRLGYSPVTIQPSGLRILLRKRPRFFAAWPPRREPDAGVVRLHRRVPVPLLELVGSAGELMTLGPDPHHRDRRPPAAPRAPRPHRRAELPAAQARRAPGSAIRPHILQQIRGGSIVTKGVRKTGCPQVRSLGCPWTTIGSEPKTMLLPGHILDTPRADQTENPPVLPNPQTPKGPVFPRKTKPPRRFRRART